MASARHDWRPLYPFGTRHVEMGGHRMHYVDEGEGQPLLFVHGNPTWSFYWRNLIKAWRSDYRCIAMDHLGCGLSDKPQVYEYCLTQHAANLISLIEQLNLSDITLLAHDWGGAIGMLAATQRPERFRRFVLFNTGAFPPPRVPRRIAICRTPLLGRLAVRGLNLFALAAQAMATARPRDLDPAVLAGLIVPYDSWANRIGIQKFIEDIPLNPQHPTYEVLARLEQSLHQFNEQPFLLVWGMRDWCFSPDCLERFKQHLPAAEVVRLAEAGHWVIEDEPQGVIESVGDFLKNYPIGQATLSSTAP